MPGSAISLVDGAIIGIYLVMTLMLGFWLTKETNTLSDYLVGGRSLPWYAVLGSIIATETSAVSFLSVPGLVYATTGNMKFLQLALGFILGRWIAAYWLLPSFFEGSRFSAYEVLRERFGGSAQKMASILFLITRTVADGLRLYLTAIVISEMLSCSMTLGILVMATVTVIYSASGGIKSIIWNDCLQLIIYLLGAVLALGLIIRSCEGSFGDWLWKAQESGKFDWLDLTPSWQTENLWAGLLGGAFLSLATHGTDQMMVQRYLSARSLKDARIALLLSGPCVLIQFMLFLLVGVALWAYYQSHPIEQTLKNDQVFAHFIVHVMPVGMSGLTLAAVLSVAMSTISSSVGSSASTFVTDLWLGGSQVAKDEASMTWLCRVATVGFGLLQAVVALAVAWLPVLQVQSVINQVLTLSGFASGIVLGIFLLTISRRKISAPTLTVAMISAVALTSLLVFAPKDSHFKIVGTLAAFTTATVTVIAATAIQSLANRMKFPHA
jgi:SSS family transporter